MTTDCCARSVTIPPSPHSSNHRSNQQDVSTLFSVPTDSLKRVTRERKYAIEETVKCLEKSKTPADTADLIAKLKALRQRFADTHDKEQACIRKLRARVEYVAGNVLETERGLRARRGDRATAGRVGSEATIVHGTGGDGGDPMRPHAPVPAKTNAPYVDVLVQE